MNSLLEKVLSLSLFASLIILIQLNHYLLLSIWLFVSIFIFISFDKKMKSIILIHLLFGIGFIVYLFLQSHWIIPFQSKEWQVLFNRLLLMCILAPFIIQSFFNQMPLIPYGKKPKWNEFIYFPFIWSGFHRMKVATFLFIAVSINLSIFVPFIFQNGWSFLQEVWLLAIIFAISNAILEEFIWRGYLLHHFANHLGEKWAVVLTSLGFGLQHYSLGFPWIICLAFSIGGLFYGAVTIQSQSMIPAIIWHMILNILMVLSGFILTSYV